jgi:hypothetical protein
MKAQKQIAKLTSEENHAWEFAFCFYREECKTDSSADKLAWRDLQLEFLRLKDFSGCC